MNSTLIFMLSIIFGYIALVIIWAMLKGLITWLQSVKPSKSPFRSLNGDNYINTSYWSHVAKVLSDYWHDINNY